MNDLHNTILQIARFDMNFSDDPRSDIDEHLSKEEASDLAEEKRDRWIEDNLVKTMDETAVFSDFLQEETKNHYDVSRSLTAASSYTRQIHRNYVISAYRVYCIEYLGHLYDSGKQGNHA